MKSRKSGSNKISVDKAFKLLGVSRGASVDEINQAYKSKLEELQKKNSDSPDKLVSEGDELYLAYRTAYMSKEGADEDEMLPLTLTGPDTLLEMFGIQDLPKRSMKVQVKSETQYKDGQLVKKELNKSETTINKDGKRETKVWENGKLVKHTIDGKDMLKSLQSARQAISRQYHRF